MYLENFIQKDMNMTIFTAEIPGTSRTKVRSVQ
jgi:hypothetical protein